MHRYELVDQPNNQPNRRFLRNDLALKVIMDRGTEESCNLKIRPEFSLYGVINTKEETVLKSIKDKLEGENMRPQCSLLGYRINIYFHYYLLAIKI